MSTHHNEQEKTNAVLKEALLRRMPLPGDYPTPITGFVLHRRDVPNVPENCFSKPILAVTIQGAKRTIVGNTEYRYGAGNCLLTGVDMPSMSYLTEASPEEPYLVISLDLDSHLTSQLAAQIPEPKASGRNFIGTGVVPTDIDILKAFLRLVELLDKPEQIPVLSPVIVREVHLRLLLGPLGELLKAINTHGTQSNHIFQGINLLRSTPKTPLDVERLASQVNMAPPTFRKHFKAVTGMSPTQYHKHLRLYEAQRLMLEDKEDATKACYLVGYESLSQFNREYKRLFGEAPQKNVAKLR